MTNSQRRRAAKQAKKDALWPNEQVRQYHIKRDAMRGHQRRAYNVLMAGRGTVPSIIVPQGQQNWKDRVRGIFK